MSEPVILYAPPPVSGRPWKSSDDDEPSRPKPSRPSVGGAERAAADLGEKIDRLTAAVERLTAALKVREATEELLRKIEGRGP